MKTLITFDLKLPFRHPLLLTEFDHIPSDRYYHVDLDQIEINPAFREWANSQGYSIAGVELFSFPADFDMEIHVDGDKFRNKHKINWTYSAYDHSMNWYVPNENWNERTTVYEQDDGKVDDYSYSFERDEVDLITSTWVKGNGTGYATVVNSGIPHGIKTMGGPRISVSATLYPLQMRMPEDKDWGVPMEDAWISFSDFVVEGTEQWYEGTIHS